VPPLQEMFNMAGMQLPDYLKGKEVETPPIVEDTLEDEDDKKE